MIFSMDLLQKTCITLGSRSRTGVRAAAATARNAAASGRDGVSYIYKGPSCGGVFAVSQDCFLFSSSVSLKASV